MAGRGNPKRESLQAHQGKVLRYHGEAGSRILSGYYAGWQGHLNLGDDILYEIYSGLLADAVQRILPDDAYVEERCDIWRPTPSQPAFSKPTTYRGLNWGIVAGGSTLYRISDDLMQKYPPVRDAVYHVFGTGVQKGTGSPDDLEALQRGAPVSCNVSALPGFPAPEVGTHWYGGVRGPLTHGRICHRMPVIFDAALAACAVYDCDKPLGRRTGKMLTRPYIAVNVQVLDLRVSFWGGTDEEKAKLAAQKESDIYEAIAHFADLGYQLAFFTLQHEPPDVAAVRRRLAPFVRLPLAVDAVQALPTKATVEEYMSLLRGAEIAVGIKLHANILSAAAETPFVQVAYSIKSLDFAASVDWLDMTIWRADQGAGDVIRLMERAILERDYFSRKLRTYAQQTAVLQAAAMEQTFRRVLLNEDIDPRSLGRANVICWKNGIIDVVLTPKPRPPADAEASDHDDRDDQQLAVAAGGGALLDAGREAGGGAGGDGSAVLRGAGGGGGSDGAAVAHDGDNDGGDVVAVFHGTAIFRGGGGGGGDGGSGVDLPINEHNRRKRR